MAVLIAGLALFLGIHLVPVFTGIRASLRARLGEGGYRGLFSLVSVFGLLLIVWGYGIAREAPVIVWDPPLWTRHLAALLNVFAFVLLAAAYLPGRIRETVRHPMLAAVKLWAFAHLMANGTLADILLFGSFLAWALVDRISVKRRERAGLVTVTGGPVRNDIAAIVIGGAVYVLFAFWLHEALVGVAPFV